MVSLFRTCKHANEGQLSCVCIFNLCQSPHSGTPVKQCDESVVIKVLFYIVENKLKHRYMILETKQMICNISLQFDDRLYL